MFENFFPAIIQNVKKVLGSTAHFVSFILMHLAKIIHGNQVLFWKRREVVLLVIFNFGLENEGEQQIRISVMHCVRNLIG